MNTWPPRALAGGAVTHDEAKEVVSAYQFRSTRANPAQYRRYWEARKVVAEHGGLQMTAGQRGFVDAMLGNGQAQQQAMSRAQAAAILASDAGRARPAGGNGGVSNA